MKKEKLFNNITDITVASISIYLIGILVYIAAYQLGYLYILEWIEGSMMDHVHRILEGKSIYSEPSIEFAPSPYTPIYFYVSAFFSLIFGPTIKVMRWISVFSTVTMLLTTYLWAKKESESKASGLIAAGMFALCYWYVSEWFFLARVDMLSLALFAWSAYLVRFRKENTYLIVAGILTALSILSKQNTLGLAIGLLVAGSFFHKKKIFIYLAAWFVPVAIFTFILNILTDGRYWYYTMIMPMHHGAIETRYLSIFTYDISIKLLSYIVASAVLFWILFKERSKKSFAFYLFFSGALFVSTYLSRLKVGGASNSFLPFFLGGGIFFGILYGKSEKKLALRVIVVTLIIFQVAMLSYDFRRYIPNGSKRSKEHKLVEGMKKMEGSVWLVSTGHLSTLAGKGYSAHQCLISDMLTNEGTKKEFSKKFMVSFQKKKFDSIIVKNADKLPSVLRKEFKKNYKKTDEKYHILKWLGSSAPYYEEVFVYKRTK